MSIVVAISMTILKTAQELIVIPHLRNAGIFIPRLINARFYSNATLRQPSCRGNASNASMESLIGQTSAGATINIFVLNM